MTGAEWGAAAPFAWLSVGVLAALLTAPRGPAWGPRAAATAALAGAAVLWAVRLGAPAAPFSPLLADDALARLGGLAVALIGLGCLPLLRAAPREGPALLTLAAAGAALLAGAVQGPSLFLGLEIVTLTLIGLAALPLTRPALEAAWKLLILGGAGASALLLGLAFALAEAGHVGLHAFSGPGALTAAAAAFLLAGLALKFALAPFHAWTPDLFVGGGPAAAAFAGAASKLAVGILLIRLMAEGVPEPLWSWGLGGLAAASMLLGNLMALRQRSLLRLLGWSSVAQSGYVAAMLAAGHALSAEGAAFHLAVQAPAVVVALAVAARLGSETLLADLQGLAWRRPVEGAALATALILLAGLPITAGFVAKLYLFGSLAGAGAWVLLAAAILGSGMGLYVYFRAVAPIFRMPATPAPAEPVPAVPAALGLICLAAMLVPGVWPGPLTDLLRAALP